MQPTEVIRNTVSGQLIVNGQVMEVHGYRSYRRKRITATLEKLPQIGARKIVEVGAHPWVMTALLIDDPSFEVCATISAEEITNWPDDIGVSVQRYHIQTACGNEAFVPNYSANIERTLFDLQERPDTVLACEIVEHLIRSPHIMFLNINRWLPVGGKLLVTTPNGAQFSNPFRRKSPSPAYRCNVYGRHSYLYTVDDLTDLIELCGFKIIETEYWDVYEHQGLSVIYDWLSRIPLKYCRDKFMKTICVVAEKDREVAELARCPRVYDSRDNWEFIARSEKPGAGTSECGGPAVECGDLAPL